MEFHTTHAIAEAASQLQNPEDIESQASAPKTDDINYNNDLSSHTHEQFNLLPESVIVQSPLKQSNNDSNIIDNSKIENATMGSENDMTQAVTETIVATDNIPVSTDNMLEEVLKKAIEEDNPHEDRQIIDDDIHMTDIRIDDPTKSSGTHHDLDNEAFSKLLEIDSKDDKELFSTNDGTEDHISKSVTESNNNGDIESIHMLTNVKDSEDKTRESTVKLEDDKKSQENLNSTPIISTLESKKISLPFSNTPEMALSPRNNEKSIVVVKPEDGTNGESNLVQKLFIEKSLMEQQQRKNSIIPGMFHTNDLHPKLNQLESLGEHGNSLIRSNNGLSPLEAADPNLLSGLNPGTTGVPDEQPTIFAYARLDFQNFTFYVQTLHAIIGRRSENDTTHKVDVNLGPSKSISRRHAQIFYNFGTGRFELSIIGKNGAFVDDNFVERGKTVPLTNKTKIQIGQIPFQFVLPDQEKNGLEEEDKKTKGTKGTKATKTTAKKAKKAPTKKTTVKKETTKKTTVKKETAKKTPAVKKDATTKREAGPKKKVPKTTVKKEKKPAKAPKKVYTLEEIPEQYRTKPVLSYSAMLTTCIRKNTTEKGMSLSEIYAGIRELFPFYKYCPDGWQSSVRHNLSLNKSFRKVSKEGKGWLWGLDESYIAEREQLKQKQAEAAKAKQEAAQARQEQQQQQKAKKANSKAGTTKKQSISQTLAANRSANNNASRPSDHQRTMKYLQGQLMILTKDRKGLTKQVIANILTQALAMTINQVTQAAKNKGISGNPLTALMDKNPKHLNLILAAAVNAATAKVTNGKIKSLVSMNPPTIEKPKITTQQPNIQRVKGTNTSTISQEEKQVKNESTSKTKDNSDLEPESENLDNSFDPTSLSRFFQPKQQTRATLASTGKPTTNITPQKRPLEESSDESSDESTSESESESDSDEEGEEDDDDGDEEEDEEDEEDEDDDEEDEEDEGEDDEDGDEDEGDEDEDEDDEEEDNDEDADGTDDNDDKSVTSIKLQDNEDAVLKSSETATNISKETNLDNKANQTNNTEKSRESSNAEEKPDTSEDNDTRDVDGDLVMKDIDNVN